MSDIQLRSVNRQVSGKRNDPRIWGRAVQHHDRPHVTRRWPGAHATAIVALANTLGFANWGATPWVIGAMIDGHGLDAGTAGLLSTIELVDNA